MTTELEKQFFDTFGIEPQLLFYDLTRLKEATNQEIGGRCAAFYNGETKEETIRRFSPKGWKVLECKDVYVYPQITDRILLELICLLNTITHPDLGDVYVEMLKTTVLQQYLKMFDSDLWNNEEEAKKEFIQQVQALFDEE